MHAEAEGEVRDAAAAEHHAVGLVVGLRVPVGGVQHEKHTVARLERLAAQLLLQLDHADLGTARTVITQQLLNRALRDFRLLPQRLQFGRKAQQ